MRTRQHLAQLRRASRELRARQHAIRAGAALPFTFDAHFADVGADGGFHIVIGNPPWVRMREIAAATRARLHDAFRVCRAAAWVSVVSRARKGRGFAGQVDLAALFVERGLSLCRDRGVLALDAASKVVAFACRRRSAVPSARARGAPGDRRLVGRAAAIRRFRVSVTNPRPPACSWLRRRRRRQCA